MQERVSQLETLLAQAQAEADERVEQAHRTHRRDLVPVDRGSVVVWRRQR